MKAIILAAGRGSRMQSLTAEQHKCKVKLWGKSLIEWQLQALEQANIKDIAIVRGYLGHTFTYDVHYFDNARWSQTNMVASLLEANEWLSEDECVITYSDIVYGGSTVEKLTLAGDYGISLTYDVKWLELWSKRFDNPLDDAETFKVDKRGYITEIGNKTQNIDNIQGQYMGLFKTTPAGWALVTDFLRSLSQESIKKMDMTTLFKELCKIYPQCIKGIPVAGGWFEVDNENDLRLYSELECQF